MPRESTVNDFGTLAAYLVPGATVLVGLSPFSATLRGWLATASADSPTVGGFLYLTVASLAVGLTISALRWATVDAVHARTGVRPPPMDFSRLGRNVEALTLLIEIQYKHYLFYSNMLVAVAIAYTGQRLGQGHLFPYGWADLAFVAAEALLFAASRDTLRKYYSRCGQLLAPPRRRR